MGKRGQFEYSYNTQISVDEDNQIIVGEHVSQNANDQKEASAALKEIEGTTGKVPEKMSLDNGFFSGANLETFEDSEVDAYIACGKESKSLKKEQSDSKIKKDDFKYDEKEDRFICPQGHAFARHIIFQR